MLQINQFIIGNLTPNITCVHQQLWLYTISIDESTCNSMCLDSDALASQGSTSIPSIMLVAPGTFHVAQTLHKATPRQEAPSRCLPIVSHCRRRLFSHSASVHFSGRFSLVLPSSNLRTVDVAGRMAASSTSQVCTFVSRTTIRSWP